MHLVPFIGVLASGVTADEGSAGRYARRPRQDLQDGQTAPRSFDSYRRALVARELYQRAVVKNLLQDFSTRDLLEELYERSA
ncbi:hypothetical protein CC1G_15286 [Coprinopsis cinerea okayama7|uniref:Uncharacterized protein n=1 Tax=Coprinopsis cinerea (strain Okayama-7 / 130 / ATCC MYA-4618 / FGSC 9003) TaxID=240176 RepID=D6RQ79_COPC7|nr:hypothetical protein CC1G_15286 [Coprinopsis cinerea okayama7\|eukprot:XP_002910379.1 hypothetical protein CC1G_15286 [Coprinopsis cinerea okayama7\